MSEVSTGALLRALTFLLAQHEHVSIRAEHDGNWHVWVDGRASGTSATLAGAIRAVTEQCTDDGSISMLDAARRARVRLPEGGLATLTRVTSRSKVATVRTDEGRWRHLPVASLCLYEGTHDHHESSKVREP